MAASDSATIELARPFKAATELVVDGAIEALGGTTTVVDYSTIVK